MLIINVIGNQERARSPNTPLLIFGMYQTSVSQVLHSLKFKIFCCKINTTKIINEILENEFSSQTTPKFNKNTFKISVNFNQFLDFDVRDNAPLYIIHLKKILGTEKNILREIN